MHGLAQFIEKFLPNSPSHDSESPEQVVVDLSALSEKEQGYAEALACLGILTISDPVVRLAAGPPEHARWFLRSLNDFAGLGESALGSLEIRGIEQNWVQVLKHLEHQRIRPSRPEERRRPIRELFVSQLLLVGSYGKDRLLLLDQETAPIPHWSRFKLPALISRAGDELRQDFDRVLGTAVRDLEWDRVTEHPVPVDQISATTGAYTRYSTYVFAPKAIITKGLDYLDPRRKRLGWMAIADLRHGIGKSRDLFYPDVFENEDVISRIDGSGSDYELSEGEYRMRRFTAWRPCDVPCDD